MKFFSEMQAGRIVGSNQNVCRRYKIALKVILFLVNNEFY
jgi:hypothetical protein